MAFSLEDISAELTPIAKKAVRATDEWFDDEVEIAVQAALSDLRRVGVAEACFGEESPYYPLVKQAVVLHCKAFFGQDNPNAEMSFWRESYEQTVDKLLNSAANEASSDEVE